MTTLDAPSRLPWPPMIYIAAVATGILAGWLVPTPWWPSGPFGEFLFALGWLIVAGAVAIEVAAIRALRRAGTTVKPTAASSQLVTAGPFSFTRNPLYLGNTMIMIGIALITGNAWFLLLAIVAAALTAKLAIQPEERHLEARFGKRFRDYSKKVRRWI